MAPPPLRPENALKRAEELISVGEAQTAVQSLHEFITMRRIRYADPAMVEPIVFKFLELGVELRKGKLIKDGLHQYKKLIQGSKEGLISVGAVTRKFIDFVEKKLAAEHVKAEAAQDGEADDLEGGITPENLLISVYDPEQSVGGFNDEAITTWMRFTWDSYRTTLDLLRNNSQLEITYSGVVSRAMLFCLKFNRKNEFRRLVDMLRQHLDAANYQQSKSGNNLVNLSDADTVQRYLDQRFQQVDVSVKLELWHEAFRSIEDVFHLLKNANRQPKASILANYYQNMIKVFSVSGDRIYHTLAWKKFFNLYSTNPKATDTDFQTFASTMFLSALVVQLDDLPTVGYDHQLRLNRLVGVESRPNRKEVLASLIEDEKVYGRVCGELKALYEIVETSFDVTKIKADLQNLLPKLQVLPYFKQYVKPLTDVIVRKIFVSASEMYNTVHISELFEMATLPAPLNLEYWDIEKSLLQAAVEDYVSFSIDQLSEKVNFIKNPFDIFASISSTSDDAATDDQHENPDNDEDVNVEESDAEDGDGTMVEPEPVVTRNFYIRNKLSELSYVLNEISTFNELSYMEKVKIARERLISQTQEDIENRKKKAAERAKQAQEEKKKRIESLSQDVESTADQKQRRFYEEKAAIEARKEEEATRRQLEKKKKEFQQMMEAEMARTVNEINAKGQLYIDPEKAKKMSLGDIRKLIVEEYSKTQGELVEKNAVSVKRLDHFERAMRKTEIPILKKEMDELRAKDVANHESIKAKILDAAKEDYQKRLDDHTRLRAVYPEYQNLKEQLFGAQERELNAKREKNMRALEKAKKERLDAIRQERYEKALKEQREEVEKAEKAKRLAKLDEIARKQREMEEMLERQSHGSAPVVKPVAANAAPVSSPAAVPENLTYAQKMALKRKGLDVGKSNAVPTTEPVSRGPDSMTSFGSARAPQSVPASTASSNSSTTNEPRGEMTYAEKMRLKRQQQQLNR